MTAATVLFFLLTIGAYALSRTVASRRRSPFTVPVFFRTSLIVLLLIAGTGASSWALWPRPWGIAVGAVVTIVVALVLGRIAGFEEQLQLALAVKSTTAPVALELTRIVQGNLQLAAALVIATGMIGAMFGQWLMDRTGIDHPLARGLAMGTISHGWGTAQVVTEGELQGAIAVAMGLAAIVTTIVVPPLAAAFT